MTSLIRASSSGLFVAVLAACSSSNAPQASNASGVGGDVSTGGAESTQSATSIGGDVSTGGAESTQFATSIGGVPSGGASSGVGGSGGGVLSNTGGSRPAASTEDAAPQSCAPLSGIWTPTAKMKTGRVAPMALLLQNGTVLVAGGRTTVLTDGSEVFTSSAELYDPTRDIWSAAASMAVDRQAPAVVLQSGKVLVLGGIASQEKALASVEIYDPSTDTWGAVPSMAWARIGHTATVLLDGKVLVAGGDATCPTAIQPCDPARVDAELYDPASETWSAAGTLDTKRRHHAATRLQDGRVLVAGGVAMSDCSTQSSCHFANTSRAEIYDPTTGTWTPTGDLTTPRQSAQVLLNDGRVLTAGGASCSVLPTSPFDGPSVPCDRLSSAEVFDPSTGTWSVTGTMNSLHGEPLTLLCTGEVLVAAGFDPEGGTSAAATFSSIAEIYDPVTGSWRLTGTMHTGRDLTSVVRLADARVMVIGGQTPLGYGAAPETFE